MSRVGVSLRLHNAVGNLATYICLHQSFVAILFERCRDFLAHVACRNLPWQGLSDGQKAGNRPNSYTERKGKERSIFADTKHVRTYMSVVLE